MNQSLINKFFSKYGTTKEIKTVVEWFFGDESEKQFDKILAEEIRNTEKDPAFDRERHFQKVLAKLEPENRYVNEKKIWPWAKIAATAAIILLSGFSIYYISNFQREEEKLTVVNSSTITKSTEKGQKLTTYLPDGSKVTLNSLSKISYKLPFDSKARIVDLEGEAFFEVVKNSKLPFKVLSFGVTTTALGTSFNVNARNESRVDVALVTGKVSVENSANNSVILDPGNIAITDNSDRINTHKFAYLDHISWKDGILSFNTATLTDIVSKLEDWYGVRILLQNEPVTQFHYTGSYKEKALSEVLKGISFVHHFNYSIDGNDVEINFDNQ
ncbi:FecR domain-containing protein [Reichenbachiella sp. MALMAid0571]|uniref:FecR family protein n=1 Tax=Reichenbachiella sp. MALMAid0571 TaxID=3143939 RepID=UPI0032DF9A57